MNSYVYYRYTSIVAKLMNSRETTLQGDINFVVYEAHNRTDITFHADSYFSSRISIEQVH